MRKRRVNTEIMQLRSSNIYAQRGSQIVSTLKILHDITYWVLFFLSVYIVQIEKDVGKTLWGVPWKVVEMEFFHWYEIIFCFHSSAFSFKNSL